MILKLRRRFIRIAMLSFMLVLVLLVTAVNLVNYFSISQEWDGLLNILTENAGSMPQLPPDGGKGRGERALTPETPFSTRYFVLRYDSAGTLVSSDFSHIAAVDESDAAVFLASAVQDGIGTHRIGYYVYRVVETADGCMAVFLDCRQELNSLCTSVVASVCAVLGCTALVYVLILFFSGRAIDPMVRSAEKQKRFITDASHELKTPLTIISTSQKVLEMDVGPQKWIDKTLAQVEKLRALVDELVALSRLDEETPRMTLTRFSVSEAVEETAESFRDYAAAQGHELQLSIAPELMLCGDEYAVRRLVSVLTENAVKHALAGGSIRISLSPVKRGVKLQTENDCTPIDPPELERIFDRFYRVDQSRSRQTGGFGMGLSIARGIVENHGGSIRADCPIPGKIVFTAILCDQKIPKPREEKRCGDQSPDA